MRRRRLREVVHGGGMREEREAAVEEAAVEEAAVEEADRVLCGTFGSSPTQRVWGHENKCSYPALSTG
jgi:hypothetical protein